MATYDIYVATPKSAAFDWESANTIADLDLAVHVGSGLSAVLSLARTIDAEEITGRKLPDESWLASGTRDELIEVIDDNGWDHPDELDALPEKGVYLVGIEH